ncbi:MAG TPA: hypothetical protein VMW67_03020 [Desulfobacteria bacterium]|nr:hypothetical protein [Desulfobacteria bacterium]
MVDNSDESEGEPPKKITYQRLPREVEEVVGEERAVIEDTATITFDGRQYLVRFPTEISDAVGLSRQHKVKFTVTKPKPRTEEEPELTMQVIKDAL